MADLIWSCPDCCADMTDLGSDGALCEQCGTRYTAVQLAQMGDYQAEIWAEARYLRGL